MTRSPGLALIPAHRSVRQLQIETPLDPERVWCVCLESSGHLKNSAEVRLTAFQQRRRTQPYTGSKCTPAAKKMPAKSVKVTPSRQILVSTFYLRRVNSYSSFKTQLKNNSWNFQWHLPGVHNRAYNSPLCYFCPLEILLLFLSSSYIIGFYSLFFFSESWLLWLFQGCSSQLEEGKSYKRPQRFLKYMNTQRRKYQSSFPVSPSLPQRLCVLSLGCILQNLYIQKYIVALHKLSHNSSILFCILSSLKNVQGIVPCQATECYLIILNSCVLFKT